MKYTREEVSKHNTQHDCWVVVDDLVLNVSDFMHEHPGGFKVLIKSGGKDVSNEFHMLHRPDTIQLFAEDCIVGHVDITSRL